MIKLYEDNSGGLAIAYDGVVYTDIEHATCGFSDLCQILIGELDGDMHPDPDANLDYYDEIAHFEGGRIHIDNHIGLAGRRCLGLDE